MRVYVGTTSPELESHRQVVCEIVGQLGWSLLRSGSDGERVEARERRVASADLVIGLVGWQPGAVPQPEQGGNGSRAWLHYELGGALRRAQTCLVLQADESWPRAPRAGDSMARAELMDLRTELARVACRLAPGTATDPEFRALLRRELGRFRADSWMAVSRTSRTSLELRSWAPADPPQRPYPLLLPYAHPGLLAGREQDLDDLLALLRWPSPVLGLHAPSGAGKSSLLRAGLVANLRAAGRPIAYERHPLETGIGGRLLGDVLAVGSPSDFDDLPPLTFVDRLLEVARSARMAPILVIDQFEDLFRKESSQTSADRHRGRATLGTLLAATSQRLPGYSGPPCRWVLAYRRDFHGAVFTWLEDVLREARELQPEVVADLPHDLTQPDRFHAWAMPLLGAPRRGSGDPHGDAARVFQDAIERPLELTDDTGRRIYPWRFSGDGAARLAAAFASARIDQPSAPLAPELQVVLSRLLNAAPEPLAGEVIEIEVPAEPENLIDRALENHLEQALVAAYPARKGDSARVLRDRSRAVLVLRELADLHGKRQQGRFEQALVRALGPEGAAVLERFTTSRTRLVVPQQTSDGCRYVLSHDRLAEVLVEAVDSEGRLGELDVNRELLRLHRFVVLRTELFQSGETEAATTDIASTAFALIEDNQECLLWGEARLGWWRACCERRARETTKTRRLGAVALVAALLIAIVTWRWTQQVAERKALLDQVASAEPAVALAAIAHLSSQQSADDERLRMALAERAIPAEIVERGLGGIDEEVRSVVMLKAIELLLPSVWAKADQPEVAAGLVWALDFLAATDQDFAARARRLREQILDPIRRSRPPPPGAAVDLGWVEIPAGSFRMGSEADQRTFDEHTVDERPAHDVEISAFRLLDHEVTNQEVRLLFPEHPAPEGGEHLPAVVDWYRAYIFSAWLGGRLPTEAEWEYAALAGCPFEICDRHGQPADLSEVAWWVDNSADPTTGEPALQAGRQLEPNPWGLYDMVGNVWEWNANWYHAYSPEPRVDPFGPASSDEGEIRSTRGNFYGETAAWVHPKARRAARPSSERGFRVWLPAASSTDSR